MEYECRPLGDRGLLLQFGNIVDSQISIAVHQAHRLLSQPRLPGVCAMVPSFAALLLEIDLLELSQAGGEGVLIERIAARLEGAAADALTSPARVVEIPTRYGGDDGPDLIEVARRVQKSPEEVVALHTGPLYRVAQIGFQPGFPYLLGLAPELLLPRRDHPRARVPGGSVAMAGAQTGIYPQASPGGWHLLGRTRVSLFDPANDSPALLRAGDLVRFIALDH